MRMGKKIEPCRICKKPFDTKNYKHFCCSLECATKSSLLTKQKKKLEKKKSDDIVNKDALERMQNINCRDCGTHQPLVLVKDYLGKKHSVCEKCLTLRESLTIKKICATCKENISISLFYHKNTGKHGRSSSCKKCMSHTFALYRQKKRKTKLINNPERNRKNYINRKTKAPMALRAIAIVRNEILSGRLKRPKTCSWCNKKGRIVAHHNDYKFPLDIQWFCQPCHMVWHSRNGEGLNKGEP